MAAVMTIRQKSKIIWLAFTFVILIAFFFRFYRLADHPLGIFFDPAINGLDAIRLIQRGGYVLFFPTNGGRESLFMYLLIPFIWLFDTTPFTLRALTTTISLLTVALLFGFLKSVSYLDLGRGRVVNQFLNPHFSLQANVLWFATLSSLVLATSYWHITISRLGQRPILVPMLAVPLFWFFLKGWATGQTQWFVFSGIFMGLEGYTYSAARLLPIILLLAVMPEFLPFVTRYQRDSFKAKITYLLIFVFVALIVYLPMGWYLLTHPAQFSARAFSVMVWNFLDTPTDIITEIGHNLLRVLSFFCCTGSPNVIFGLPGHPGLPPVLTPFLFIGLIVACKNWRHLFFRLVALWWFVGIMPSIIAIEAPHPLRMIVAVVPTAIFVALGLIHFSNWLHKRLTPHALPWLSFVIILITIPSTFRAYFIDWTKLQSTQGAYDYGAVAIRDVILDHFDDDGAINDGAIGDGPIYLPLARFNDSTLLFYLSGPFERQAVTDVTPTDKALVISPERSEKDTAWVRLDDDQMVSVLPPLTHEGQQLIQSALADDAATPIRTVTGETVAHLAHLSTDPAHFLQQPTHTLTASFGPIQLSGANYPAAIDPSFAEIPVILFWQAASQITDEYEVILHLVDDNRQVWGNGSGRPTDWVYPSTFWRPNVDIVAAQHQIVLAAHTLTPGRYWLAVSLFDPATQQRLPLTGGDSDSPDTLFIGPLKVPLPRVPSVLPLEKVANFGNVVRLTGFQSDELTIAAGDPVNFVLQWEALSAPNRDYTVFVHLLDQNDNIVAGHDAQPLAGVYPTSIWTPGERILDPHTLPTVDTLPSGQYRLALGLYHQPTGERLPLSFADNGSDTAGRLILPQPVTIIQKMP